MTKRIFRSICLVALAVLLAALVLIMGVLYDYFSEVQQEQLRVETTLAAQGVATSGESYFDGLETEGYRITWIQEDGTVLYDSQANHVEMENHLEREEVKEALEHGYGESVRYSDTMMERQLYSAQRLSDSSIVRVSSNQYTVVTLLLGMMQPMCIILFFAAILASLFASKVSRNIVKPMNELNLDEPLSNEGYDELSPLLRRIASQQEQLKTQEQELQKKQDEFRAITSSMTEGLILLNNKGAIISMNHAACQLFNVDDCIGDSILTVNRSRVLQELLAKAQNGERAEATIELNGSEYQLDASPVKSEDAVTGVVLLLFDVTEKVKAEQLRREFTANVSHELKTPLHTISGCAELMMNHLVKPEDMKQFTEQIYAESQRMIQLVEDIIELSHLDEGAEEMKYEKVDLLILAKDNMNRLQSEADEKNVTMSLLGDETVIYGIPQLLTGIVYNLCDNAIKYNREGGKVQIEVRKEEQHAVLTVKDTGIGISAEHHNRVFERFYRVDKSHSKEVGGTGLGLSIVKHACKVHNAKLELQSVPNEGTTVMIVFPCTSSKF